MEDESAEQSAELNTVQHWRVAELTRVGMQEWQAVHIALESSTGWSDARNLIEGGCPPHLAFDIVR